MGFKLRREVRDLLPPGLLTAGERNLVLELADNCDDISREGWPGVEWLAEKADLPETKVGEMFNRIGKKWVELRVPAGVGRDGRPYYSKPGRRTEFLFPLTSKLQAIKAPQNGVPSKAPEIGGPKPTQTGGPKVPQKSEQRSSDLGDPSPLIFPQEDPSSLSAGLAAPECPPAEDRERDESDSHHNPKPADPRYRLLAENGITDETEAAALVVELERENKVRNRGWWTTVARNGDLPVLIEDARRALATPPPATWETYTGPTHPYQHDPDTGACRCGAPVSNRKHAAGHSSGRHEVYRNPINQDEYDDWPDQHRRGDAA